MAQAQIKAASADVIECYNPATGERLGQVKVDSPADVQAALKRARQAQATWRRTSFALRRKVLAYIQEYILDHADELCRAVCEDAGKTLENAMLGEIWPVCEKLRWTIANGERYLKPEAVSSGLFPHKKARIEYQPLGVVGIIAPWNYPLQNILGPVIPALMAGNACLVKVSEAVAWSSLRFQKIFDQAFDKFGLPRDLVIILNGYAETGAALVKSGVDIIVFTGSLPNGRRIIEASAQTITPVILELGGKDPMIICDDADLEQALHTAMGGVFIACGQNCLAAERILVQEGIYDQFVARIVPMVQNLKQGAPLKGQPVDVGAIVSPMQLKVIQRLVDDAVAKGARVLAGGKPVLTEQGQFFAPTVLADVTDDMDILHDETFGPVMVLIKFKTDEEAVRIANATEYGLSSSVFSKNLKRARAIAEQIQAGSTVINDFGLAYMAQDLPFGGVKGSGFGRLNGKEGLRAMTNKKAVLDDRLPLHIPPKVFPVDANSYPQAQELINLIYRKGLRNKLKHAARLLKNAL